MSYVLESSVEFDRLERQSQQEAYDYRKEVARFLVDLKSRKSGTVLDAGCGSGIVSRYLAESCSHLRVLGFDASTDRISKAKSASSHLKNLDFQLGDLTQLKLADNSLDGAVCRFVIEHLTPNIQQAVLKEILRCLKPGATFCAIDLDGVIYNAYPNTPFVLEAMAKIQAKLPVDLIVGRKLPAIMTEAGFSAVDWDVSVMSFKGEVLQEERQNIAGRIEQARPILNQILGSKNQVDCFAKEYLEALDRPDAVVFYNKFVVHGKKPQRIQAVK